MSLISKQNMGESDSDWFYCLKHRSAEQGCSESHTDRLGPFPSQEEAAHALQLVRRRNNEWVESAEDRARHKEDAARG
ncbi:hypothetical protein [Streptomyces sp. NPDC050485]|uniref:hypothetical protein n=1 Tax=Streptomyces sp. NPDC050485 TaxID=3365617 RepID=UPI0037B15D28